MSGGRIPRDAAVAGVVRLHRMLRRGTVYGPELPDGILEDDGVDRGLMFAFIGAHPGRQFEFVQSEWMNQGEFLGIGDTKDPIGGCARRLGHVFDPEAPDPRAPARPSAVRRHPRRRVLLHARAPRAALARRAVAMIEAQVLVIGAGPAGVLAAVRAGDLGARTVIVTHGQLGGMAADDGPVPVRCLAHAARLIREARQLGSYGIGGIEPTLDYGRVLERARSVVVDVRAHSALRAQIDTAGVTVHERTGAARFVDPHTVTTESGLAVRADNIILCTGGTSRRLSVPGFEFMATHSDAWGLRSVPPTMIVLGGGATGAQVAFIFNAFGTRVALFEAGPRILTTEDEDVSSAVTEHFRRTGIEVHADFGDVERFERTSGGVRMVFAKDGVRGAVEGALVVGAVGWIANTVGLGLERAGVELDGRGFVRVDAHLRTSAPHVLAAGDVTGRLMLVSEALQDGFVAASNAVNGSTAEVESRVCPIGSFTEPEYAKAGMTEAEARATTHDVAVAVAPFDSATRPIIDGRTYGFCKLIVDRRSRTILGCHVVGERAVDIVQSAAIAIAADMRVDALARLPLSFPTYTGVLARVAAMATRQLNLDDARTRFSEHL